MSGNLSAKHEVLYDKALDIAQNHVTRGGLTSMIYHALKEAEQTAKAEELERCAKVVDPIDPMIATLIRRGGKV